jgi:hypothetical protein
MNVFIGSFRNRLISALVIVLLLAANAVPAAAGGANDGDAAICERALSECLGQASGAALVLDWRTVLKLLFICISGYTFCEKYVAPYLHEGGLP